MVIRSLKKSMKKKKSQSKSEVNLKKYQLRKFGKCFQCLEPVPRDCNARCNNCGYEGL